jgi:hypothetical protein
MIDLKMYIDFSFLQKPPRGFYHLPSIKDVEGCWDSSALAFGIGMRHSA